MTGITSAEAGLIVLLTFGAIVGFVLLLVYYVTISVGVSACETKREFLIMLIPFSAWLTWLVDWIKEKREWWKNLG